jgi:maleate isomerase
MSSMTEPKTLKKIGHITPSSNTALEPITALMNRGFEHEVSHHFDRIRVRRLELNGESAMQFDLESMLNSAKLLADAPLDAIVWNGTSASWLGVANDQRLVDAISRETGVAATTTTLAYYEAYKLLDVKRIALAVPYTDDLTRQIAEEYARRSLSVPLRAAVEKSATVAAE